jgi:hypothetical protein
MITATTPAQKAAGRPNSMPRSDGSIGYKVWGGRKVRHESCHCKLNVSRDLNFELKRTGSEISEA